MSDLKKAKVALAVVEMLDLAPPGQEPVSMVAFLPELSNRYLWEFSLDPVFLQAAQERMQEWAAACQATLDQMAAFLKSINWDGLANVRVPEKLPSLAEPKVDHIKLTRGIIGWDMRVRGTIETSIRGPPLVQGPLIKGPLILGPLRGDPPKKA